MSFNLTVLRLGPWLSSLKLNLGRRTRRPLEERKTRPTSDRPPNVAYEVVLVEMYFYLYRHSSEKTFRRWQERRMMITDNTLSRLLPLLGLPSRVTSAIRLSVALFGLRDLRPLCGASSCTNDRGLGCHN